MAAQHPWGSPEWADAYLLEHGFWPIAGGENDDPPKDDPPKDEPKPDDPPKDDDDPDKVVKDDDWQTKARKHENAAKRERKAREALEKKLRERDDETKSEHEKALDKAREEARNEALSEAEKGRRADRLENASIRLAAKGFQIGEGDDAHTVKFADPDDALIYVERAIRSGDVDEDDIYDGDGKVQADALKAALADILESKPHLRASEKDGKPKGDPDSRKGDKASSDLESMTAEDHAKRKYPASR